VAIVAALQRNVGCLEVTIPVDAGARRRAAPGVHIDGFVHGAASAPPSCEEPAPDPDVLDPPLERDATDDSVCEVLVFRDAPLDPELVAEPLDATDPASELPVSPPRFAHAADSATTTPKGASAVRMPPG